MNYLAHALLAEPYAHSLIGNLAGDLVKGPLERHELHPRIADGIRRHRRIDVLTDTHPDYQALRRLFPQGLRRVAGIVLDVVFDHLLCSHWARFSSWDRVDFTRSVYAVLSDRHALLPAPLRERAPGWVDADWLRVYETREGIEAVLGRLAARLSRRVSVTELMAVVDTHRESIEAAFLRVFASVQMQVDAVCAPDRTECYSGRII